MAFLQPLSVVLAEWKPNHERPLSATAEHNRNLLLVPNFKELRVSLVHQRTLGLSNGLTSTRRDFHCPKHYGTPANTSARLPQGFHYGHVEDIQ
jgi:hypothetical protein